jgi:hypothetical protein
MFVRASSGSGGSSGGETLCVAHYMANGNPVSFNDSAYVTVSNNYQTVTFKEHVKGFVVGVMTISDSSTVADYEKIVTRGGGNYNVYSFEANEGEHLLMPTASVSANYFSYTIFCS